MSQVNETPAVVEAIQAPVEEVGFKVFVGNLAFATKDADLSETFSKVGEISNAQVINRGARSLGYGFVTFLSESSALSAISTLDKSELSGRQINVELAKPPTSSPAGRIPKAAAKAAVENGTTEGEVVTEGDGEGPKKARKPRAKRPKSARKPRTDAETEEAGDAPLTSVTSALESTTLDSAPAPTAKKTPKPRTPRTKTPKLDAEGNPLPPSILSTTTTARRGPPTGLPSKTLLFVANLPFSLDDTSLSSLFSAYKIKSARVVTKKYGVSAGRSKGFGFVDFENEEEQKKALEGLQGKEVDGRELLLKIAIQEEKKEGGGEKEGEDPEATIVAS